MRNRLILLILILAIITGVIYSPLTSYLLRDFMIYRMEKALNMSIVYNKASFKFPAHLTVLDLKAIDKNGLALTAQRASFKLSVPKLIRARVAIDSILENASLGSGLCASLNNLLKPLGVRPQDTYNFDDVTAAITAKSGSLEIRGLSAIGSDFKISGDFARFKDKKIDYNIELKINKRALVGIGQDGIKNRFLIDEDPQGWYTAKLSMRGDPRKPSDISFSTSGIKLEVQSNQSLPIAKTQ